MRNQYCLASSDPGSSRPFRRGGARAAPPPRRPAAPPPRRPRPYALRQLLATRVVINNAVSATLSEHARKAKEAGHASLTGQRQGVLYLRDRRRRGGPEGPPSNDHQDKLQMIARIKGQEKRFRTPKRTNKPPTHPTTTGSTKATTRSYGVRSSRSGLLRHQTGASL